MPVLEVEVGREARLTGSGCSDEPAFQDLAYDRRANRPLTLPSSSRRSRSALSRRRRDRQPPREKEEDSDDERTRTWDRPGKQLDFGDQLPRRYLRPRHGRSQALLLWSPR